MTVEQVLQGIDDLYSDTSKSLEETLDIMDNIGSVVDMNIEALKEDIKRRDSE